MFMFLASLAMKVGVPARFAKVVGIGVAVIVLLVALWGLKSCYDSSVIENANNRQDAANTKADIKANEKAAEQRRQDDTRLNAEAAELRKATENAQTDRDRRVARQRCLRLQQAARASNSVAPSCARPSVPSGAGSAH